jgi:WD40 repeat protein
MALSPDGKTLCTAGQDDMAHVLDMEDYTLLHNLPHPAGVNGVVFTNDSNHVLTGCGDSAIRVVDVQTGEEQCKLSGHKQGSVTDLCFSPDGKLLASSGMDRTVRLWDVSDLEHPKLAATLDGYNDMVFGVAISPNGKWLATADWGDQIRLLDLTSQKEKWAWRW